MNNPDETIFDCPFSQATREAGRELYDEGQIRLKEQADPALHEARVPFFRRFHEVSFQLKGGGAEHFCTCPHLQNTGEGCPHLYGLLLAVQERQEEEKNQEEEPSPLHIHYALAGGLGPLRVSIFEEAPEGEGGELRPCPMDAENLGRVEDADDLRILRLLAPHAGGRVSLLDGGGFLRPTGPWEISGDQAHATLKLMGATGRLHARDERGGFPLQEVASEPSLELVLRMEPQSGARDSWSMRGVLLGSGDPARIEDADVLVPGEPSLVSVDGRLVSLETFGASAWLKILLGGRPVSETRSKLPAFLKHLARSGTLPRLWLPGDSRPIPIETGIPEPRLRIDDDGDELSVRFSVSYGGREGAPAAEEQLFLQGQEQLSQVRRDPSAEARCLQRFIEVGAAADEMEFGRFWLDREILMMSLPALMDDGFRIEVNHRPVRRSGASTLGFEERGGRLRLTGGILFDDQEIGIGAVIAGRNVGDPFLHLEDGSLGFITDKWSETLAPLAALGEEKDGALTFSPTQGLLVEQVLEGTGEIRSPRALGNLRSQLQSLSKPQEAAPPTGFVGSLRPYQSTGLGWLRALAASGLGGCLADDMGLGKTVQVAAFLLSARREDPSQEPALVTVPRSLLFNWEQELARFVPDLRVIRYTGASRRALRGSLRDHHVILTTYGTLRRDVDWLADQTFSSVVLDEAQAIKNPVSQVARAVRRLQTLVRVSVTGTPVENRLLDFWSQMEFLNPGLLGSHRRFQESTSGKDAAGLRARLARTLGPLVLRRTKEEVAPELPEKLEQILHAPLLEEQAELYHRMRLRLRADLERRAADDGLPANRIHVLEGLLRLRQIACHPGLLGADHAGASSGKLDLLMERLSEVRDGGHKALVFSQFTTFLGIVRDRLEAGGHSFAWLDGKTLKREEVVRRFQEDADCPFFLLSLKAGGVGLNLTAADYVFLLDPWWNPAVEAQAIDRAHRIGREGRVLAFRLVSRGTIEERVLALQEEKRALVDDLLGATAVTGPSLDEADLVLLLGD